MDVVEIKRNPHVTERGEMLSTMALVFGRKANNICKEMQIVQGKFGHFLIFFVTLQADKSS